MLRQIVRFKCNIDCAILVLHLHGRETHSPVRVTEFRRDKFLLHVLGELYFYCCLID